MMLRAREVVSRSKGNFASAIESDIVQIVGLANRPSWKKFHVPACGSIVTKVLDYMRNTIELKKKGIHLS